MVRCGWEVNLGRICLSMKRARGKKPEEINLAPASSSAAQNGKHQKRFVRCSPVISLKTVQLEVFLSVFVFLWTRVFFSLFLKHLNSRVLKASIWLIQSIIVSISFHLVRSFMWPNGQLWSNGHGDVSPISNFDGLLNLNLQSEIYWWRIQDFDEIVSHVLHVLVAFLNGPSKSCIQA